MSKRSFIERAKTWRIREVTDLEIEDALHQMPPEKALGPDSYNAACFQKNRNLLKFSVFDAIKLFFRNGKLLREVNHTFLTLVPKCSNASSLSDYGLIACCNVIYKLISKILYNRHKVVVGKIISLNQSTFFWKGEM